MEKTIEKINVRRWLSDFKVLQEALNWLADQGVAKRQRTVAEAWETLQKATDGRDYLLRVHGRADRLVLQIRRCSKRRPL